MVGGPRLRVAGQATSGGALRVRSASMSWESLRPYVAPVLLEESVDGAPLRASLGLSTSLRSLLLSCLVRHSSSSYLGSEHHPRARRYEFARRLRFSVPRSPSALAHGITRSAGRPMTGGLLSQFRAVRLHPRLGPRLPALSPVIGSPYGPCRQPSALVSPGHGAWRLSFGGPSCGRGTRRFRREPRGCGARVVRGE
jgi:hypothetical protein